MSAPILAGSATTLRIPVYLDRKAGTLYQALASALRVEVDLVESKDKTYAISIDSTGSQVILDSPSTGYLTVQLESPDTDIDPGRYDVIVSIVNAPEGLNTTKAIARQALIVERI